MINIIKTESSQNIYPASHILKKNHILLKLMLATVWSTLIFPKEPEGCRRYNETRERAIEWARQKQREVEMQRNSLNLSRCISHDSVECFPHMPQFPYFVSTNQEVQTHWGAPHQPPISQINLSTCHWNVTAKGEESKQRQTSNELHNFLTGSNSDRLVEHHGWQDNELYFTGCRSGLLYGCLVFT